MVKRLFALLPALLVGFSLLAQDLPSDYSRAFAFPLGSHFVLQIAPNAQDTLDIRVIEFEPFEEVVDMTDTDALFKKKYGDDIVSCYFTIGKVGKDDKNRVFLILYNYSPYYLSYDSLMQIEEEGEFKETSNVGIAPNAVALEMWPHMIFQIALSNFRKEKTTSL